MTHDQIAELLTETRARTLLLLEGVGEDDLRRQHDPLMGPILWDLGHIAHFEELWLLHNLDGRVQQHADAHTLMGEMPGTYNPFENPRAVRGELKLYSRADALHVLADIRARTLESLRHVDLASTDPLLRDGYVYHMVLQHEQQHNETMLQTLQLKQGAPYRAPRRALPPARSTIEPDTMVRFPGGDVVIGTNDRQVAYDNERPQHVVAIAPFWIDVTPVTNGTYLRFMAADGYTRREFWSDAGWRWLRDAKVRAPRYWDEQDGAWRQRVMDRSGPVDPAPPVCHVCFYEAEAYARFAGKRLPTEVEWEAAASWDPVRGRKCLYPWGDEAPTAEHANLDQLGFGTAPVGAYPRNVSAIGCYGMIGDVWEWTTSDFEAYRGFEPFPYREYSAVFFGSEYKVLRGGSWATRPGAIRTTFRNWDYPDRRQIFSGFRCARDG